MNRWQAPPSRIGRLLCALLCAALLLAGCASSADPKTEQTPSGTPSTGGEDKPARSLTLAYTANDSLNPYLAKTKTNQELGRLLYDGLVILTEELKVEYALAREITVNGTQVLVALRDAVFSDGSPITAEDVLASMEKARKAETASYGQDFENVQQTAVTEDGELSILLRHEDPYFVNFLDFPVYKSGSEELQNSDNLSLPPVGSGRYVYHEEAGRYWLTANPRWYGGAVSISRIELLNLPDDDAIAHAVQVGTVNWYYSDLSDNTFPNMTGKSVMVPLPNLVFLGANTVSGVMSIPDVRRGISAAIDRTELTETVFFGVANPAAGPYPSALEAASGLQTIDPHGDPEQAASRLDHAGFTRQNEKDVRASGDLDLTVRLLYHKENSSREELARALSAQLTAVGCRVALDGQDWDGYVKSIQDGYYDLYLGEMRIPDNLDLFPLLTAGGLLTITVTSSESDAPASTPDGPDADDTVQQPTEGTVTAAEAAYRYHTGRGSLTEMLSCMDQQLSIIPLCHRTGMLIYSGFVTGQPAPTAGDPFRGIERCGLS